MTEKTLIVSDSHGWLGDNFKSLVKDEKPDVLIHLGDLVSLIDGEWDKDDLVTMETVLKEYPEMSYIHINGGMDSDFAYDTYISRRKNSVKSNAYLKENFMMMHNLFTNGDNWIPRKIEYIIEDIGQMHLSNKPVFVLYGHTHRQALSHFDMIQSKVEDISFKKGEQLKLDASFVWLINPGTFQNENYCILEKDGSSKVRFY